MKGISPIIATVLLIAFTIGVAGIVVTWLTGFTSTSTEIISRESDKQLICSYASVSLRSLTYNTTTANLTGSILNTAGGTVTLGNFTLQTIFTNASVLGYQLCSSGTTTFICTTSNLTLLPQEQRSFNVGLGGSNYQTVRISTNCTNAVDEVPSGQIVSVS